MPDRELPEEIRKEIAASERVNISPDESQQIFRGELLGKGGNSQAYEVQGRPGEVLLEIGGSWGGKLSEEKLQKNLERVRQKIEMLKNVPSELQAPKILQAWVKDGTLYEIMERAKGKPVHDSHGSLEKWQSELEILANAPDEHFAKLINDVKILHELGFQFDPSKPDNFFYDPETGFHIIDLEPGKYYGSMEVPLIHTNYLYTKYGDRISNEVKQAILKILEKLRKAGDLPSQGRVENIERKLSEV